MKKKIKILIFSISIVLVNVFSQLKTRLMQDCRGKRMFKEIKNIIKFKPIRDTLPLVTMTITVFYLFLIFYVSILDFVNVY